MPTTPSLRAVARAAAGTAAVSGTLGGLSLLGAFGPVSCWTSESSAGEVTRGCESGIDVLLGSTTGNAPVLFFWAVALLGFVALGATAAWTGRRRVTWGLAFVGLVVSVVGVTSVGWYFALPTLCLLLAGAALTVAARRGRDGSVEFGHLYPDLSSVDYLIPIPANDEAFDAGAAVATRSELRKAMLRHERLRLAQLGNSGDEKERVHNAVIPVLVAAGYTP